MTYVLSANRLADGRVVYLSEDQAWSTHFKQARRLTDADLDHAQEIGKAAEAKNLIVDSYAVELAIDHHQEPARLRERIRGFGPTVGDHQPRSIGGPEG